MKNIKKLSSLVLVTAITINYSAFAGFYEPTSYAGLEMGIVNATFYSDAEKIQKIFKGKIVKNPSKLLGIILGTRLHKNYGVESGLSYILDTKTSFKSKTVDSEFESTTSAYVGYIGVTGYLPILEKLEAIATTGLSFINPTYTYKSLNSPSINANELAKLNDKAGIRYGVRVGIGLEYTFNNISARLIFVRHITNTFYKSLGIIYNF